MTGLGRGIAVASDVVEIRGVAGVAVTKATHDAIMTEAEILIF